MNYFDPTIDGVVIAGGDGTVQEVRVLFEYIFIII